MGRKDETEVDKRSNAREPVLLYVEREGRAVLNGLSIQRRAYDSAAGPRSGRKGWVPPSPAWVVTMCLLLLGCAHYVETEVPIPTPPLVDPVPLGVGIYYTPELQAFECETGKGYLFTKYVFRLGDTSIKLFDLVFTGLFEKTIRVSSRPPLPQKEDVAGIIELTISNFTGCEARWPIVGITTVSISYNAILWSLTGQKITEWTGTGVARPFQAPAPVGSSEAKHLEELTAIAMREATADFVVKFQDSPKINSWFGGRGTLRRYRQIP